MHLTPLPLATDEVWILTAWARRVRQRRRARAVLSHNQAHSITQLASFHAVQYATVRAWLAAWHTHDLAGAKADIAAAQRG